MVPNSFWSTRAAAAGVLLFLAAQSCMAHQNAANSRANASNGSQQGVYLVFPFQNAGSSPRLEWLSEGLEELTIRDLNGAGQQVYSHAARTAELERNALPFSANVSRASMVRIAQDLDADFVIFGSFSSDGKSLTVDARVLRIEPAALLPAIHESAPLASLMDLQSKVVWKLLASNDRSYTRTLGEFAKAQPALRLDAFEHYIRGEGANDDEVRLRELREASRLEPAWADVDFALGEAYVARNDCTAALSWFAHVPKSHERYAEAAFYSGVCRLQQNQPDRAEDIFTSLQTTLGLPGDDPQGGLTGGEIPEILNNLAIARERQGKTAAAEADLRRATDLDPDEDDYPFNLGLLAFRAKDFAAAAGYFREASERKPENAEDRALLIESLEKGDKKQEAEQEREAANVALGPNALPVIRLGAKNDAISLLERVKGELDTAAIRFEMEAPKAGAKAATENGGVDSVTSHLRRGRQELTAGRLDAAEAEFRATLHSDPSNAVAHRGLGEIQRRRGKLDDAVKEFQASLETRDSAVVRTLLARVYLEQKKSDLARTEVQRALKVAPNYTEAKQLLERLQSSKPNGGAQ